MRTRYCEHCGMPLYEDEVSRCRDRLCYAGRSQGLGAFYECLVDGVGIFVILVSDVDVMSCFRATRSAERSLIVI
jgi:hypothetical protein